MRGAAPARLFDGQQRLGLLLAMLGAELVVVGAEALNEGRLELQG